MPHKLLLLFITVALFSGCSHNENKNPYADLFEAERIRSILVVPAVNRTVNIEAPWVLLSTLPEHIAESGYYVFPINTVKVVLEHEGLYEAAEAHALAPTALANMFDADSVLYITIHEWESKYVVLSSTTRVRLSYRLVSRSGVELWSAEKTVEDASNNDNSSGGSLLGNIIFDAIGAAIHQATPDYRPLALKANQDLFVTRLNQWPDGPYLKEQKQDKKQDKKQEE